MTVPPITLTELGGDHDAPLLLVGASLGTSVSALWSACADLLAGDVHVVGWDLPGHGRSPRAEGFTMRDLADGLVAAIDQAIPGHRSFHVAGDSLGGAVSLQLALDHPDRVSTLTLLCSGARIGTADGWAERASTVRASGTAAVVELSARRWFAPGFLDRSPETASRLLTSLRDADAVGYVAACEALAAFDVRDRLAEIRVPVLAVAGSHDVAAPVDGLREVADGVAHGRLEVLEHISHMAPAEDPETISALILGHVRDAASLPQDPRAAGEAVRRAVLGDAHVDRAAERTSDFTREFQDLITRYAWGTIWTRPGLDRRSRSMITLTALVAGGHHEELALHARAALRNGLTPDEIKEVLLQSAIYCGVPAANTAFRLVQDVLDEAGD